MDHDLGGLRDLAEQCLCLARRLDPGDQLRTALEEIGHSLLREICRLERRDKISSPLETAALARGCFPKLSDDDLLAFIGKCGRIGDVAVLHRSLNEQIGDEVDLEYLLGRLQRLCHIGALRILQPSAEGTLQFELTQGGVHRRGSIATAPVGASAVL